MLKLSKNIPVVTFATSLIPNRAFNTCSIGQDTPVQNIVIFEESMDIWAWSSTFDLIEWRQNTFTNKLKVVELLLYLVFEKAQVSVESIKASLDSQRRKPSEVFRVAEKLPECVVQQGHFVLIVEWNRNVWRNIRSIKSLTFDKWVLFRVGHYATCVLQKNLLHNPTIVGLVRHGRVDTE